MPASARSPLVRAVGVLNLLLGLLALGASLKSGDAKNALVYAAEKGHIAAAQPLLDSFKTAKERLEFINTEFDSAPERTKQGYNPTRRQALDVAREKGHHEVASLIERAKARK